MKRYEIILAIARTTVKLEQEGLDDSTIRVLRKRLENFVKALENHREGSSEINYREEFLRADARADELEAENERLTKLLVADGLFVTDNSALKDATIRMLKHKVEILELQLRQAMETINEKT